MLEPIGLIVAFVVCAIAAVMAIQRSTWLIDYVFFVVALNRGVRRMVDYHNGSFNPFSLISLTPIICGGMAVLVVLLELNHNRDRFGTRPQRVLLMYSGVIAFSFVIGFINAKFGAVYALGDYIAPIGLMGFGILWCRDQKVMDRWCTSFALSALTVAVYGIWQFYTIPPWDSFWLISVDFVGYMGLPEPTKMTLFSTMAERGPAAMYLCSGVILLSLRSDTLGKLRLPSAAVILYAMLLTYSRTTVIFSGLAVILFPILNRGTGVFPILILVTAMVVIGPSLMNRLPGQALSRVETIGAIQDDGSFKGRIVLLKIALGHSISNPLGLGIGSHGLASRIENASSSGVSDSTGYVEMLSIYGWIGFVVMCLVLLNLWRASSDLVAAQMDDRNVHVFRAWFVAGMAALFSGNWLAGASFFWVLAGYCLGRLEDLETFRDMAIEDSDASMLESETMLLKGHLGHATSNS